MLFIAKQNLKKKYGENKITKKALIKILTNREIEGKILLQSSGSRLTRLYFNNKPMYWLTRNQLMFSANLDAT